MTATNAPRIKRKSTKCKTCQMGINNPTFRDRLYIAWFERPVKGETLEDIGKEVSISHFAIYRHANNHMRRKSSMIGARDKTAKEIIQIKGKAMKDLEVSFDHDIVVPKEDYESVIDEVLADGLAQMRVKGKDVSINQLIAAAKIKGDWRAKKRGQDTELIKMMYRSMNGFTEKPSTVGTGGSERPSDLLREVAGNATPSGSEALFASSSPTTG